MEGVTKRMKVALIALTWAAAGAVLYLLTVWPAFSHVWGLEQYPIGALTGWIARGAVRRKAAKP